MEIEYYEIPNNENKRIRKYKPIQTQGEESAKQMFIKWFKKTFKNSSYTIISIF